MKHKIMVFVLCSFLGIAARAQAPEFDNFGTFNIYPLGVITGEYSGTSFGGIQFCGMEVWKHTIIEASTLKFLKTKREINEFNDHYTEKDFILTDGLTLDIGVNFIIREVLSIGIVPYSFTWSAEASDGLAILSKYRHGRFVFEGKAVPIAYFKGYDEKWFNNNSYLGANYYMSEKFALGLKHNRQGKYVSTSAGLIFQF